MIRRTKVCAAITLAFTGTMVVGVAPAFGQQQLERVEITGSSIKRVEAEGSLPVTIITRDQIVKSGAVSVTELMQNLPSMQGFVTGSQSVNGSGGGQTTASLHSVGSRYTLVLLNGRRFAPTNTTTFGATVNLESIPLAAVERVEVLTDGASALYGADAIAGVVNFILRKERTDGAIELSANKPQHPGAGGYTFSATKGIGDVEKDAYNVLFAFSYDKENSLKASQRDFANTGFKPFTQLPDGRTLGLFLNSSNSVPGNVLLALPDGSDLAAFYNPNFYKNGGTCPALHTVRPGGYGQNICRFDFTSQVELIPESERTSFFTSGRVKVNEALTLFSDVALSRFEIKPLFAPPAQPGLYLTQKLYDLHVAPYLAQFGLAPGDIAPIGDANGNGPSMNVRVFDAGGRQDNFQTDATHIVLGGEGLAAGWDYNAALTLSQSKLTDKALSGYLSSNFFYARIADGSYDPLAQGVGESASVLAPGVLKQVLDVSKSNLNVLSVKASRALATVAAGDIALGLGADIGKERYVDTPSAIYQGKNKLQPTFTDSIIGGGGGALPFDSSRHSEGVFAELAVPIEKGLDFTGSVRYDNFSVIKNVKAFDPLGNPIGSADQGKASSATTYKLSARYQPSNDLLFRGSYGTGFKAPTLLDVANPLAFGGSTSGTYDCPISAAQSPTLAAGCRPSNSQYNILQGGNTSSGSDALKPEKSTQWTFGMRAEPSESLSAGVDFWRVELKDRILNVPEQVAFANAGSFLPLFTIFNDPITGQPQLTFIQKPVNLGKARYQGLDMDVTSRVATPVGRLTTKVAATYMIKSQYQIPGLSGYQSSLGQFGPDNNVVFRLTAGMTASLEQGAFIHTVNVSWKPSYKDQAATNTFTGFDANGDPVFVRGGPELRVYDPATGTWGGRQPANPSTSAVGNQTSYTRRVASYSLFDFQTRYAVSKDAALTFAIKNLFDREPPMSIQDAGGGNMRGFDGRYASPIGRQFYASGSYKF